MANRQELAILRGARTGDAACQLALGKLYLRGGAGLPLSLPTALHWLSRAAGQGLEEAWLLIGSEISHACAAPHRDSVLVAFGQAAQAGVAPAAVTFARLLLQDPPVVQPALRARAREALQRLSSADAAELLARLQPRAPTVLPPRATPAPAQPEPDRAGERAAQLALGLQWARMDRTGERVAPGAGSVNFKRAIACLTRAGELGEADAWFALARIYMRTEFSQRSASEAQAWLERAAALGHAMAQFECGMQAWRLRREEEENDVRAVYWLQKAAAQGCEQAHAALERIAPPAAAPDWTAQLARLAPQVLRDQLASQPLLAARIDLAMHFQLSRAEALLLDVDAADRGHCLVVDIRAAYGRCRRRIVLVRNARQRQALDRAARVFESIDAGVAGPEGNYRRRLYRLKSWLAQVDSADGRLAA
jgi:TPR repeat protein